MDIKSFILIGGGLLIAAVIAHGFWIAWRSRREPYRLDIVPDLIPEDVDEMERLRGELPNGGARVVNKPHQADLKQDYGKIQTAALEQKKAEYTEKWVLEKLRSTYLSVNKIFADCPNLQEMLDIAGGFDKL